MMMTLRDASELHDYERELMNDQDDILLRQMQSQQDTGQARLRLSWIREELQKVRAMMNEAGSFGRGKEEGREMRRRDVGGAGPEPELPPAVAEQVKRKVGAEAEVRFHVDSSDGKQVIHRLQARQEGEDTRVVLSMLMELVNDVARLLGVRIDGGEVRFVSLVREVEVRPVEQAPEQAGTDAGAPPPPSHHIHTEEL
jgi:hypothetical protein